MAILKDIYSSLENNIRALLEVPENTPVEEIESFLRPYQFEIVNKDRPLTFTKERTKAYVITGSKPEYERLEGEALGAGYSLELDVKFKPCKLQEK